MLIAFKIVCMACMFILTVGTVGEENKDLRRDIQYILLIDTFVLVALFILI